MKTLRLVKIYALASSFAVTCIGEFILSQTTGSLVLLLDSYHNLFTLLSLVLLVISHKLSDAQTIKNTFGWIRIEILGTLFNMIFFAALLFSIFVECIQTMAHSGHEQVIPQHPLILVIAGSAGIFLYVILQLTVGGEWFLIIFPLFSKRACVLCVLYEHNLISGRWLLITFFWRE